MQGYSPKLPLARDKGEDGLYGLNKTILESIKQNLKMLLLTSPGERIMDSNFGVGVRRFLFEQDSEETREELENRIHSQVNKYLSFIKIDELTFSQPDSNNENLLFINLRYSIPSLGMNDEINLDF
jgi:phage baseplate assembly protein W